MPSLGNNSFLIINEDINKEAKEIEENLEKKQKNLDYLTLLTIVINKYISLRPLRSLCDEKTENNYSPILPAFLELKT